MEDKKYYSQEEVDTMIKESILKNAKEIAIEIKKEKLSNKDITYV